MTASAPAAPTFVHHLPPAELVALTSGVSPPCLSLYLPTHRRAPETPQDRTRLRRLLTEGRAALEEVGLRRSEVDQVVAPATSILEDPLFWQRQGEGLALLLSIDRSHVLQLPFAAPELSIVGERFHIHPLAGLLTDDHVLLLTLTQQQVRLFDVGRWSATEIEVPDLPAGVDDTLPDHDRQVPLQLHRAPAGSTDAAFFHGHGGAKDAAADQRRRYLRAVEHALRPRLARRNGPLVLAGVRSLVTEFRSLTSHRTVLGAIDGNPDPTPIEQLREATWEIAEPWFAGRRQAALERYEELAGTGLTAGDPEAIMDAALEGRVDTLLLPAAIHLADTEPAMLAMVDDALLHTLRNGGTVYVLPADATGDDTNGAAILRY